MLMATRDKRPPPLPAAAYSTAMSPLSRGNSISTSDCPPPPWEVLALVSPHLDPKTLAVASCVSRSWRAATSSDHLWRPLTTARFPSLATALKTVHPSLPYRLLYGLAHSAATSCRLKPLPKPSISLDDLIFSIDICGIRRHQHQDNDVVLFSLAGVMDDVATMDPTGDVFRFDVGAASGVVLLEVDKVRVMWHVVLRSGWTAAFTLMDRVVPVRQETAGGVVGLFSQELPPPRCCPFGGGTSGMAADLKMQFSDSRRGDKGRKSLRIEKLSLGLLSTVNWRYVSVEDGLRYLQHFLLDTRFC